MSTVEDQGMALAESPSSRFTAVNEKEQPTIVVSMNGMSGNGASRRTSPDERPRMQSMMPPPGQEKLSISTSTSPPQREEWILPPNGERPQYHHAASYPDPDLSHKRKRSTDVDLNSPPSATSYHSHGLPSSAKQVPTASIESDALREESPRGQPLPDSRDPYNAEAQYRSYLASTEDNREAPSGGDLWHSRQYSQQTHISSDEHLGEVLQRASQNLDAQQRHEYEQSNHGDDDRSGNPNSYSPYSTDQRDISTHADLKKRKRNFSNRTKTGCMTCRRRKKKCDELRPECNNCLRGGFVCSGYQQRGQWPKPEQKTTPVPLQSKTDYEKTAYPQPTYNPPLPQNTQRREPLPGYRGQALRVDPHHGRRINVDDDQPSSSMTSASTNSPEKNRLSAISFSQQTVTPITASSSAYPDRNIKSPYDRIGPLHDMTRQDGRQELETPQSAQSSSLPPLLHPQMHTESPRANPQVAAQLALSNLASANRPRTQKEDMLAGRHYFPFDKELVLERERCSAACSRFNSSIHPNNRASPEERSMLFRDILNPRDHVVSLSEASPLAPVGRVGDNVVVETPFSCDYGYNITIGQDVAIGKNCTILDTCEIVIGDRCNLGPNVNIYAATLPVDPKKRLGSRGPSLGRKIVIESDCWIGGNATILPGRTIGKGSTVGAGSIVTRDVPPYTVVCGNPARVIRGLYEK